MNGKKSLIAIVVALCFINLISPSLAFSQQNDESSGDVAFSLEPSWFHSPMKESAGRTVKNYFVGFLGMFTVNVMMRDWNQFVGGSGWAQVTLKEVWKPWEREVEFDTDWHWTNFIGHTYQGSLYYLSARNANLNVFTSLAMSSLGSAMWEYFCELNDPSINDLVYTGVGGFFMGEMLYRLALEGNTLSPILGTLINPLRLISDPLLDRDPVGPVGNLHELSFKAGISSAVTGTWFSRDFDFSQEVFPGSFGLEFYAVYADPYGHDSNVPFSQFEWEMGAGLGAGSGFGENDMEKKLMYEVHIFSNGLLFSRSPQWGNSTDTSVGIVFDYDYLRHSFVELSTMAIGFAVKQRVNGLQNKLEWQFHLDGIFLGTSDFYYFRRNLLPILQDDTVRDYGYTVGAETVAKLRWFAGERHILNTDFHGYAMYKFPFQKQKNDDTGWELIGIIDTSYEFTLTRQILLGISDELYLKKTFYDTKPDLFSLLNTTSLYVRLQVR